jgi:hypothetical protein
MLHILKDVAEKDGLAMDTVSVSAPADLDAAFAEMSREAPGAVIVGRQQPVCAGRPDHRYPFAEGRLVR